MDVDPGNAHSRSYLMGLAPRVVMYAIKNHDGLWFRAKGRDGYGKKTWNEDINVAKFYTKLSQARARVTFFANLRPNLPVPQLVEFECMPVRLFNEGERIATERAKVAATKAKRAEAIKQAEEELQAAQAKLNKLRRR